MRAAGGESGHSRESRSHARTLAHARGDGDHGNDNPNDDDRDDDDGDHDDHDDHVYIRVSRECCDAGANAVGRERRATFSPAS